jgi:hypothetical protein
MKTANRSILSLSLLFAALPCLAQSQSQDSSASTPASAKPAPTTTTAPAKETPVTPEKKKPKKVWTNDDVSSIPGSVSVVGDASKSDSSGSQQKNSSAAGSAAEDVRQKQIDGYKDQIRQLQGQIDSADKSIAQLKNFKGENNSPSGGINMNQGYNMVPLEDQVKQLVDKKKQMQAKIEDIENEARKNGIDSGDLR